MGTAPNLFSSANVDSGTRSQDESSTHRISSLFAAVREHRARTGGRPLRLRSPDDALARHARSLYERP